MPSEEQLARVWQVGRYRVSAWKAEFADALTEHRYRQHVQPAVSRYLRNALVLWSVLWLAFALSDYLQFGSGATFLALLATRGAFAALILAAAIAVQRRPGLATSGVVVTPLAMLGFTMYFALYFVSPAENMAWLIAVTTIMIIGLFVLLPNRIVLSALAAIYAIAGTMISVFMAVPETTPLRMAVLALSMVLPAFAGLFAAHRFEVVRRREFAALEQARTEIERRRVLEEELQRQASSDPLTGACNRREYERLFDIEARRARRHDRPLSVCVLDLDHFKHVNDTYGHNAGDAALVLTAEICRSELRDSDILGRLAGEEFVFIFPETGAGEAEEVAERLRARLERTDVVVSQQRFRLTGTFGVTELNERDRNINDLILRAVAALYEGKNDGRNRVCVA